MFLLHCHITANALAEPSLASPAGSSMRAVSLVVLYSMVCTACVAVAHEVIAASHEAPCSVDAASLSTVDTV
jgi:hypothetical protein